MRLLPYWIQRADFSSTDFEPVDVNGALRAFMTHDWSEELDFLSELEASASESCPPGIGFVAPTGAILHVCPSSDGRALVQYHAETTRTVLGFIPMPRSEIHTKEGVERSDVGEMIHSFFEGRHDWLLHKLEAA
jgi:hypothetical protein